MNESKVQYIDVSNMTEKEICQLLNIKYVPWYKSGIFWLLALVFCSPSFLAILSIVEKLK